MGFTAIPPPPHTHILFLTQMSKQDEQQNDGRWQHLEGHWEGCGGESRSSVHDPGLVHKDVALWVRSCALNAGSRSGKKRSPVRSSMSRTLATFSNRRLSAVWTTTSTIWTTTSTIWTTTSTIWTTTSTVWTTTSTVWTTTSTIWTTTSTVWTTTSTVWTNTSTVWTSTSAVWTNTSSV